MLSAKTPSALKAMTTNLGHHLLHHKSVALADVAYTLQTGRRIFEHRQLFVSSNLDEMASLLLQFNSETSTPSTIPSKIVFMLPDQGFEYLYMGHEIYHNEPCYRYWIDRCADLLIPLLGVDVRTVLYPTHEQVETSFEYLQRKEIGNAALFITEYALAKLWEEWGIFPQAMIGYGLGECVAACLAEVFTLEEALQLIVDRNFAKKTNLFLPKIPFLSNLTGTWIVPEQALSSDYWFQQSQNIMKVPADVELFEDLNRIFIAIGLQSALCDTIKSHLPNITGLVLPSLPDSNRHQKDIEVLLMSLGHLWCAGMTIDWSGFYNNRGTLSRSSSYLPF